MENFDKNDSDNENEESKKIINNFKSELEKIKQKLGKNYEQNSQVVQGQNNKNFHYIDKNKIEPKEKKVIEFENEYTNSDILKKENEKEKEKSTKQNTSIFSKVPSFEELKMKYGINTNNKPNGIKEILIEPNINKLNKDNKKQLLTDINQPKNEITNENNDNKDLKIFNSNKKLDNNSNTNDKYDLVNLLNLKKDTEDEINNIFNKRELLDLSDYSDKEEITQEKKEEEDEKEIEIINKYIQENKIGNNTLNNNEINPNIEDISNISNINKKEEEDEETNINNNINNNNNNINQNIKEEKPQKENNNNNNPLVADESPIKIGTTNNNSILDTSMLNSKLVQQIKLIDETSENNRKKEETNKIKLKELENTLQLDERLTHKNREIRKNAIKELCEMCTNFNNDEENRQKAFECFSPWVKYCLEETNGYVIPESLNFFILFNTLFPQFLSISIKDFFDNIERYINFGIQSINEKCFQILFMLFQDKKIFGQSINYIKILFEKLIKIYAKTNIKLGKKRKIYSDLMIYIFNNIEDDYSTIRSNLKLSSLKEIDNLFKDIKKTKENKYKFRLYNEISNLEQSINKTPEKKIKNNNEKKENKKDNNNKKDKNNINNLIINTNNNPDANDILSIIPNEFYEYHFLTQFQPKIKLLESTNNILSKIKTIKDKEKNLLEVYRTINYSIEDSNILIHLEGIKLLENICRLVQNYISTQKLKLLLEKCFDKLKDKKSLVKSELFSLFNMIIENKCLESDKFIIFILQFCSNQKKENSQVKIGLLEYIKYLFLQQNNILFYEVNKIKEKELFIFVFFVLKK